MLQRIDVPHLHVSLHVREKSSGERDVAYSVPLYDVCSELRRHLLGDLLRHVSELLPRYVPRYPLQHVELRSWIILCPYRSADDGEEIPELVALHRERIRVIGHGHDLSFVLQFSHAKYVRDLLVEYAKRIRCAYGAVPLQLPILERAHGTG